MRAALLMALAAALVAQGRDEAGLRRAWRLKLAGIDDVVELRYSPTGGWIAAVTSRITAEGDRHEVLLVPASGEAPAIKRIAAGSEAGAGVHWSPDGEYLAIESKELRTRFVEIASGTRCELPRATVFGGFVGPRLAIAADWEAPVDPASLPIDSSLVTLYNADCSVAQSWKVRGHVKDLEPSAASGIIAVSPEQGSVRLISRDGPAEVASVPERAGPMLRFGEKGTALCKADAGGRGSLVCYDIKSGERFANPTVSGGAPFDVSLESSIVLALHGTSFYDSSAGTDRPGFLAWVVWDYRTGRELGRLRYAGQRHGYVVSPAAISPDGKRIVVAARGELRMYEVGRPPRITPTRSLPGACE